MVHNTVSIGHRTATEMCCSTKTQRCAIDHVWADPVRFPFNNKVQSIDFSFRACVIPITFERNKLIWITIENYTQFMYVNGKNRLTKCDFWRKKKQTHAKPTMQTSNWLNVQLLALRHFDCHTMELIKKNVCNCNCNWIVIFVLMHLHNTYMSACSAPNTAIFSLIEKGMTNCNGKRHDQDHARARSHTWLMPPSAIAHASKCNGKTNSNGCMYELVGSGVNLPMTIAHQSSHKISRGISWKWSKNKTSAHTQNTKKCVVLRSVLSFCLGERIKAYMHFSYNISMMRRNSSPLSNLKQWKAPYYSTVTHL